jgi:hypothetical protein
MIKFFTFITLVFVVMLIGAFSWLALTDMPVPQKEITKAISNDRFYKQN